MNNIYLVVTSNLTMMGELKILSSEYELLPKSFPVDKIKEVYDITGTNFIVVPYRTIIPKSEVKMLIDVTDTPVLVDVPTSGGENVQQ